MKTSDKLLLGFSLASLSLFGVIHLALYAEYKSGKIVGAKELHDEQYSKLSIPQPKYLSLQGTIWVNIYPSDSCYIEFPKHPHHPSEGFFLNTKHALHEGSQYQQDGDTLVLYGKNDRPIHRPFSDLGYELSLPVINVYSRRLEGITALNGQVVLNGATGATGGIAGWVRAQNSTVWVGDVIFNRNEPLNIAPHPVKATGVRKEFDSLDLESLNSLILLNSTAHLRSLRIHLDNASELNDQDGLADRLFIEYSPGSRINLTGENLKRTQLSVH